MSRYIYALTSLVTLILLACVWFDVTPFVRGVLGTFEWRWNKRPFAELPPAVSAVAVCLIGVIASLAVTGFSVAARRPGVVTVFALSGATIFGFGLQYSMMECASSGGTASVLIERTTSELFTSHFGYAVSEESSEVRRFIDEHAQRMQNYRSHSRTHPPGAVLFYRLMLAACERSDWLTRKLLAFVVDQGVLVAGVDPGHRSPVVAAALLSPLVLMAFGSLTCWPVAGIVRGLGGSWLSATRIGVLAVCIPGAILMIPQLMQLISLQIALFACTLLAATARTTGVLCACVLTTIAGLVGATACFVSYGSAVFLAFASLVPLAFRLNGWREALHAAAVVGVTIILIAALSLIPMLFGHESLQALRNALEIHAQSVTHKRSYPVWVFFNLWDFAVFLGFPLAVLAATELLRAATQLIARRRGKGVAAQQRPFLALAIGLVLLDVSGTVRGEVGRIWMPLMPLFLATVLTAFSEPAARQPDDDKRRHRPTVFESASLALLLVTCAMVLRFSWYL